MSSFITPTPNIGPVQYGTDRRKFERSITNMSAILRFADRLQAIQGSICDLSVGGAGFICQQAVAGSSRCTIQFELPALSQMPAQPVSVPAAVVNSMKVVGQAYQYRVNLQFTGLPPKVRSHIEALIRHSMSRS